MSNFKTLVVITLLASSFFIFTCAKNDPITGYSDYSLGKTNGISNVNNSTTDDDIICFDEGVCIKGDLILTMFGAISLDEAYLGCLLSGFSESNSNNSINVQSLDLSSSYKFRDDYLLKSGKGEVYTTCYYLLSKYGIENNLVNKYYKEHYELLKNSIAIAYDLQYGNDNNNILINKNTSDTLKDMLKIYRNSSNHREIEPILNYLEADLEKYYNKPKFQIAADFEEN